MDNNLWIFIVAIFTSYSVQALQTELDSFPDYWQSVGDYDWYNDELEKLGIVSTETEDLLKKSVDKSPTTSRNDNQDEENDRKVADEIEKFRNENHEPIDSENIETADDLIDYQIEDNRSEVDDEIVDEPDDGNKSDFSDDDLDAMDDLAAEISELNKIKESLDDSKTNKTNDVEIIAENAKESPSSNNLFDMDTEDIVKSPDNTGKNEKNKIFLETQKILQEDDGNNDFLQVVPLVYNQTNLNETVEEAKKILDSTNDKLSDDEKEISVKKLKDLAVADTISMEEDDLKSFQEAYDDLIDNWGKLSDNWEEKEMLPTDEEKEIDGIYKKVIDLNKDYETIDDDNFETLFANDKSFNKNNTESPLEEKEPFPDDTRSEEESKPKPIEYLHDALDASDGTKNPDAEMISGVHEATENSKIEDAKSTTESITKEYEHLSDSEYDQVMSEFKSNHSEDFNFKSENFDKHVAPIHITIGDEPVVVTSPNYPGNYPTNNIIDWIFYGEGEGIEFNVTDFAVNGHLGDYLLVKPGGVDASGNEGLIFSYTLNTKRQYRFLDVNRMFVRFEAKPGMQFMRGFSFSVKLLRHMPYEPEPEPTPEPVRPMPHSTITLNLGGTTLEDFVNHDVEEEFRQLVADMATMYINANNIDPGTRTTLEVTQIVSRALCFHNWPKFENCVEIKFGVPLEYDGEHEPRLNAEDLAAMWERYFSQDPFAARLRQMGITEYQVPNDSGVLTVWLVIAAGVVLSVAMLAFALWRFSCFEDYTRMPPLGDTDSIPEKRNLDLYPTPHQTLPPLFAEHEYKWTDTKYDDSTRVDLGGYTNKNYLRDDLYDLDSDDDITAARDSNKSITPSDIYV